MDFTIILILGCVAQLAFAALLFLLLWAERVIKSRRKEER
jgi:hypothetical protein